MPFQDKHKIKDAKKISRFLRRIPGLLDGTIKPRGVAERHVTNSFWSAIALSMFESIHEAFLIKSDGATDSLGTSWDDLKPETKAYGKKTTRRTLGKKQKRYARLPTMGLLNKTQQKQWNKQYSKLLRMSTKEGDSPSKEDKLVAAKSAWTKVIASGADTYIGLLGDSRVPLGVETGALLRSLRPGARNKDKYQRGDKDQVMERTRTGIKLGTRVEHASAFNKYREFLPSGNNEWVDKAVLEARDVLADSIKEVIT